MAYLGALMFLVASSGRVAPAGEAEARAARWFQRTALVGIALPVPRRNSPAGSSPRWGASPGSCYGLLKTEDADSPTVSTWTVGLSLGVFVCLYIVLGVVDFC